MRAVIISEESFEKEFEIALDKLKIVEAEGQGSSAERDDIYRRAHRKFVYEVCQLKARLGMARPF